MGSTRKCVMARNRDIRENTLFTMAKHKIPKDFLLLSI